MTLTQPIIESIQNKISCTKDSFGVNDPLVLKLSFELKVKPF
jgi:hypothetical protein